MKEHERSTTRQQMRECDRIHQYGRLHPLEGSRGWTPRPVMLLWLMAAGMLVGAMWP